MQSFNTSGSARSIILVAFLFAAWSVLPIHAQMTEKLLPGQAFGGVVPGPDGRFYGVTYSGGLNGDGTIYSVDPAVGSVVTHVNFSAATTGSVPYEELTYDPGTGKFYGTASSGGPNGGGTIFSYVPGASSVTVIGSNVAPFFEPWGPLIVSGGQIYGLFQRGDSATYGAAFRLAVDGTGGVSVIHAFDGAGVRPQEMILGSDGNLWGVTLHGGNVACAPFGCGTIFRMGLSGDGFQTVFEFAGADSPLHMIKGSDGLIYGTTYTTVFKFSPSANPLQPEFIWTQGVGGNTDIIEGSDGRLYGTDQFGGADGQGRIFSLNRDGSNFVTIHSFFRTVGVGAIAPWGRLHRTTSGIIYGTAEGTTTAPSSGAIFRLNQAPPLSGKIVYYSRPQPAYLEIRSTKADGSNNIALTTSGADFDPSVSADGNKIAFTSLRDNTAEEIYIMNGDGTGQTRLTMNDDDDVEPSISADGTKIAFASLRDGNWEIYTINSDGSNLMRVTTNAFRDDQPAISPDGSKIAFRSNRDGAGLFNIYVMNSDGTNPVRLTTAVGDDPNNQPAFSPDGTRIAFQANRPFEGPEIYVMNAVNGSNKVRLTTNSAIDSHPAYSPDGSRISFSSSRDGNVEIYYMNADGTNQTRLTTNAIEDDRPSWGGGGSVPPPPPKPAAKVSIAGGNMLIGSPGEGLILRSPNGATCVKIGIDNAGGMTTQIIACP